MRVAHRHLDRGVAEQLLHRLERRSAHHEVRSERVPECVPSDPSKPLVAAIGPDGRDALVKNARAFYQGETGIRRGGWYAFFDDPTSHPDGTRHVQGTFKLRAATARSIGERIELAFDGMRMGTFEGALTYTFYPGSRLIRQDAVLTTNAPDVAYYYDAGLDMSADPDRQPGNNGRPFCVRSRAVIAICNWSCTYFAAVTNGACVASW